MAYPNLVVLVGDWLATNLTTAGVKIETDPDLPTARPNLAYSLPLVHVERLPGGGDDQYTLDKALISLTCYAPTVTAAIDLGEDARYQMRHVLPKLTLTGAFIRAVETNQPPVPVPYDNTAIRRVAATYRLIVHYDPTPVGS